MFGVTSISSSSLWHVPSFPSPAPAPRSASAQAALPVRLACTKDTTTLACMPHEAENTLSAAGRVQSHSLWRMPSMDAVGTHTRAVVPSSATHGPESRLGNMLAMTVVEQAESRTFEDTVIA